MMETEIHRLSLAFCHCYVIKEEGLILVDAGFPNQGEKFAKELKDLSINPRDISLILLTHGHYEHIGSVNEIKKLTGGKIAINQHEKNWVEQALRPPLPPGTNLWGNMIGAIYSLAGSFINFPKYTCGFGIRR